MAIERINKEKYMISPGRQIHYAKQSENHPDLARRIIDEDPKLRAIYDPKKDDASFNFLIEYGFISIDAEEGHEEAIYCSKSLGNNKIDLDALDIFKWDVYEEEIINDPQRMQRLNEVLQARKSLEESRHSITTGDNKEQR